MASKNNLSAGALNLEQKRREGLMGGHLLMSLCPSTEHDRIKSPEAGFQSIFYAWQSPTFTEDGSALAGVGADFLRMCGSA